MMNSSAIDISLSKNIYTDLNSVKSIRSIGLEDKDRALVEISKQFESMLVRMMMKSMRDANKVFSEDSIFSSKEAEFYQDMLDDQLSVSLSSDRGMGIAESMIRQLREHAGVEAPEKTASVNETAQRSGLDRYGSAVNDSRDDRYRNDGVIASSSVRAAVDAPGKNGA